MAALIRLALRIDGADLPGMGGPGGTGNTIECLTYDQGLTTSREYGAGMATGRREYTPLVIRKPLDRTSPLLWKALIENRPVEGTFYFLRPDPSGGAAQVYYSVHIEQARIASLRQFLPDQTAPGLPVVPMEEVTFLFHQIAWHSTEANTGYEDTWTDEL
jgi:type VI secretion system secreted protein Hcp